MKNIIKNEKARFFTFGVLAATAGVQFLKSKMFRDGCVKAIAGGMKLRDDAASTFTKMKEDAQDICRDAEFEVSDADIEGDEE